jgi:hypothetical protein
LVRRILSKQELTVLDTLAGLTAALAALLHLRYDFALQKSSKKMIALLAIVDSDKVPEQCTFGWCGHCRGVHCMRILLSSALSIAGLIRADG